jgi:small-conductance mechanosensitive channel
MNPEESPTPEPINEWLEQIEVQPLTNELPENPSTDLQLENPASGELVSETTETTELETEDSLHIQAEQRLAQLQQKSSELSAEIAELETTYANLRTQIGVTQTALSQIVQDSLSQLEQRKQALQISVEQLERRQERIRNEMRTTFAGTSQDIAIRVQGFKDYLTGSLQDLASAAEQMQLVKPAQEREKPAPKEAKPVQEQMANATLSLSEMPQLGQQQFQDTTKKIRRLLDQYRNQPDYYGPPWQLRRTFEPIHAEKISNWLFTLGGRGALRTMGSRLQNILIASSAISILHQLYGDASGERSYPVRTLILANTPERLGEWRRGLQDCLGIGRPDFGPDRGVVLFEAPTALAQKAERLVKANQMPLIIIDDSEEQISLALLQFPLWLAFAPDPKTMKDRDFDDDF